MATRVVNSGSTTLPLLSRRYVTVAAVPLLLAASSSKGSTATFLRYLLTLLLIKERYISCFN